MTDHSTNWLSLVAQLQQGDRLALIKVTRLITGYLTRYRAYELRDSWNDICQEVLMAIIKSVQSDRIQHENAFVSYVGAITRNKLADWVNAKSRAGSGEFLGDPELGQAILDMAEMDDTANRNEELMDLQAALEQLPDREKNAVVAIYIQGHSYEEAAKLLDVPLGTLKRLQTQGLKLLRQTMQIHPTGMEKTLSESGGSADVSIGRTDFNPQPD